MIGKKALMAPGPGPVAEKAVESIDTLIGRNSVLKGDLEFSGGLRVDGLIKGHITATDNKNGTLVLSETGEIEGNVTVPHVVINGTVHGNIISGGHVELQEKATVTGDVNYKAVEMALGASINGNLVCDPSSDKPAFEAPSSISSFGDNEDKIA